MGKHLTVRLGIGYSVYRQIFQPSVGVIKVDSVASKYSVTTSLGIAELASESFVGENEDFESDLRIEQKLRLITFSPTIEYGFLVKRMRLYATVGPQLNWMIANEMEASIDSIEGNAETNTVKVTTSTGLQRLYLGIQIGVGAEYFLSPKFSMYLNPLFRFSTTPIATPEAVKTMPYSYGLQIGFRIRLQGN